MTMADRSISHRSQDKHSMKEFKDQQGDEPSSHALSHAPTQHENYPKQENKPDLSSSPLHRTRLPTRDSGYGTDFSPATVITPSTSQHQGQLFVFDSVSQGHVPSRLNRTTVSSPDITLPQLATSSGNIYAQGNSLPQLAQGNPLAHLATATCSIHAHDNTVSQVASTVSNIHSEGSTLSTLTPTPSNIRAKCIDLSTLKAPCNIHHVQGNIMSPLAMSTCNNYPQDNASSTLTTTPCTIHSHCITDRNQRPSTSTGHPKVIKSSSSSKISYGDFNVSPGSFSESSDTTQALFDYNKINTEDEEDNIGRHASSKSHRLPPSPSPSLKNDFYLSQSICSLHDKSFDDEDDEDVFATRSGVSKNMNITSVPTRCRRISLSTRSRRYCSEVDDDSTLGACGGCDQSRNTPDFEAYQKRDQRSRSLNEYVYAEDNDVISRTRSITFSGTQESSSRCIDFGSYNDPESPLSCSQGFQPGYFDGDSKDNDSVFYFDHESFEDEKDTGTSQSRPDTSYSVTFAERVSTSSDSSLVRQRRSGIASSLPTSSGCLSTRFGNSSGVTVSTQTPHVTSLMIQRILVSSAPLPNEARGPAVSRLRRLSESGVPLPARTAPLPDIIMSAGRDRSLSVPNLQALSLRLRAAREVGQELRRLSDEFNCRRNLSPVHEDFDGHPASYPTMRPRYLRNTITQFGSLLMDTFRGRLNS